MSGQHERGTFAALADPAVIDHLRRLGITAIELMPIHAFLQDRLLLQKRPAQLLGLQHDRLLRAGAALSVERLRQRDARRGSPPARRRHRSDSRRGLQPHRRRQRTRADAVVSRPRQCQLLPPGPGDRGAQHQRHRHRQHAEPVASARAADGDGFAALLGRTRFTSTDFRFDLGVDAGARVRTASMPARLLRCAAPGPGAGAREADRRTVGRRTWRLSARRSSAGLRRMERPLP